MLSLLIGKVLFFKRLHISDENKYQPLEEDQKLNVPEKNEIKQWQWLWVVVRSGGDSGKVLVCIQLYYILYIPGWLLEQEKNNIFVTNNKTEMV